MNETKRFSLVKPTIETPFFIDFEWWKEHDSNWRVYLQGCLCAEHQVVFENQQEDIWIDWVNPETAVVTRVDGLQQTLLTHCAQQPDFLSNHTSLIDLTFRALLANHNHSMSPTDISIRLNRPAEVILRTLTGPQIYRGIRPLAAKR
jgi:hypothetical protein